MRRHLHGHDLDAVVAPAGQGALEVGRLGRGAGARERAEHLGPAAGGLEDVAQQVGGGGLAVGAGDPDHRQATRRDGRSSAAASGRHGDPDVGHDAAAGTGRSRRRSTSRATAPAATAAGGVVVAVGGGARDAAEEGAGGDGAGVVDDVGDLDVVGLAEQLGPLRARRRASARRTAVTPSARAAPWWSSWRRPAGGTRGGRWWPAVEPGGRGPDPAVGVDDRGRPAGVPPSACTGAPSSARSVAAGGMPRRRRANEAILENAGAAVVPPVYLPPLGSSIITKIDRAGCSAGTTPMKVDWYWVMPFSSV